MNNVISASVLSAALVLSSSVAPLAEGRESNVSETQVKSAMVSTSGSLPISGPASGAASVSTMPLLLALLVVLAIAAGQGSSYPMMY